MPMVLLVPSLTRPMAVAPLLPKAPRTPTPYVDQSLL